MIKSVTVERIGTFEIQLTAEQVSDLKENMDTLSDRLDGQAFKVVSDVYNFIEGIITEAEKAGLI